MPKFHSPVISDLAGQLARAPRRHALKYIAGAERLLELVQPDKHYPYDFACYHLTGFRPLKPTTRTLVRGETLLRDVVRLIEYLSRIAAISIDALPEDICTQEELCERFGVSLKTIFRWRQRGLSGLRVVDHNGTSRLVFTDKALKRFVSRNQELVERGAAFRHLTDAERDDIVSRARELIAGQRLKIHQAARIIAEEMGRAPDTIRYTLRTYDRDHPEEALFGPQGHPTLPAHYQEIYQAFIAGSTTEDLARQQSMPHKKVQQICREMRAYELQNRSIRYVYNAEFEVPDAERRILGTAEPDIPGTPSSTAVPSVGPAYIRDLYRVPLLTPEQERDLFRRYNFCKFQAVAHIAQLDPGQATRKQIQSIEACLQRAGDYHKRIVEANLRLVVNIASRHLRQGEQLFELISDGNVSLLSAVERFDYGRGFRFSTYATWAIIRNFARSVPAERSHSARYVTGQSELLQTAPDATVEAVHAPAQAQSVAEVLRRSLDSLEAREREILIRHYGLGSQKTPSTLEQLGQRFGLSKERVRQIEKCALAKLKSILGDSMVDYSMPQPTL